MSLYNWDLKELTISWGVLSFNANFGSSGALGFAPNAADYTLIVSPDGVGTRCRTNNKSGKLSLKLMQSNPDNAKLSAVRAAGLLAPNGADVQPFALKDRQGTTFAVALNCWISQVPDGDWGQEATERVWVLESESVEIFHGGN